MTGKTHQSIGLTVGLASYLFLVPASYNPATFAWVLIVSSFFSLLPDIDQPAARIWSKLPFGTILGELVNPFIQHRNISHSFLGIGLTAWAFYQLLMNLPAYWGINTQYVLVAGLLGYTSHLLADMITVQGIPLFFPYQRMFGIPPRPFEGIRIQTGQWFENLVVFPVVDLLFLLLLFTYRSNIAHILFK